MNAFIKEQANQPGEALLTLVQFDTEYEFVHKAVPMKQVTDYVLEPRGMTALLDAVGKAINETGERLAKMAEADRPGLVIFVIMTDGHENSSKEFTKAQIKEMIERQQSITTGNSHSWRQSRRLCRSRWTWHRRCECRKLRCRESGGSLDRYFGQGRPNAKAAEQRRNRG